MNLIQLSETIKRIESLLALAVARGQVGATGAFISGNILSVPGGAVGPAATITVENAPGTYTLATGQQAAYVSCEVNAAASGGTSVAGEILEFRGVLDGSPVGPPMYVELSATHAVASFTLAALYQSLTPGAHRFGFQVTNLTMPAHTSSLNASQIDILGVP